MTIQADFRHFIPSRNHVREKSKDVNALSMTLPINYLFIPCDIPYIYSIKSYDDNYVHILMSDYALAA